jgi:hypothetical protein
MVGTSFAAPSGSAVLEVSPMDFTFGMTVVGSDGTEAGQLDHVLVNPATREITHVVVRSPEVSEDVLLPLSLLQGNTDHELLLHLGSGDLEDMPRYYEGRTSSPPAGRVDTAPVRESGERRADLETALDVPPNACQYGPETRVTTSDNREGRLAGLAADHYANRLSMLRVRGIGPQDLLVQER